MVHELILASLSLTISFFHVMSLSRFSRYTLCECAQGYQILLNFLVKKFGNRSSFAVTLTPAFLPPQPL
jgi:hypothetical protein